MVILNANKYYSLEYSLLPSNKIKEVSGTTINNTSTNNLTIAESFNKISIKEEQYPYVGEEYSLPMDLTGNNPSHPTIAAYFETSISDNITAQGRIEYTKGYKTLNISYEKPLTIKSVKITYEGKGYDVIPYNSDWNDWNDLPMPSNFKTSNLYSLYPAWSHNKEETVLLEEIECWNNPSSGLGNDTIGIGYSPKVFSQYIANTYWYKVDGTLLNDTDKSLIRKVIKKSDYEYTIDISTLVKFNIALRVRTFNGISYTEYTTRRLLWRLNNISKYTVNVEATTIGGESVTFKYVYGNSIDSYKYQISLKSNELTTNATTIDGVKWSEGISNILINKYKDGKLWIKTKVKSDFVLNNDLHINSQLYIKDQDNEYINRKGNICTFEIKNIEKIYNSNEFYYNLILLEV